MSVSKYPVDIKWLSLGHLVPANRLLPVYYFDFMIQIRVKYRLTGRVYMS